MLSKNKLRPRQRKKNSKPRFRRTQEEIKKNYSIESAKEHRRLSKQKVAEQEE